MQIVLPKIEIRRAKTSGLAPRPPTLNGLRIGFIDGWGKKEKDGTTTMYPLMAAYQELLAQEFDVAAFKWILKPFVSKPLDDDELDAFLSDVDVVVNGEAICGSCTYSAVFDGVEVEKRGKPSVTIAHDGFKVVAGMHAKMMGMPTLPIVIEPQPDSAIISNNVEAIARQTFKALVGGLTAAASESRQ